jgi:hypothetical protein
MKTSDELIARTRNSWDKCWREEKGTRARALAREGDEVTSDRTTDTRDGSRVSVVGSPQDLRSPPKAGTGIVWPVPWVPGVNSLPN